MNSRNMMPDFFLQSLKQVLLALHKEKLLVKLKKITFGYKKLVYLNFCGNQDELNIDLMNNLALIR